ncbi:2-amino-4-hydroxy-6-hydroxymethyldihydropteridine diphosphokinase [Pasteurellaceae bacterium HPA106]|uniref:2-amino-4-hydroxy-6- hydroxymethyldihydropteridine diphosphokinase n=1 Tax=Spirabiliibacterium pneumoniae TaxID=221400 RepID=UPI001AAE1344|nr:2-amino-4-hydroxy-6-hydroxymethyldihydropteridine diphosphokinase [Spirabiliibacterium pneumoniae]MBE2895546.1 2-amino-4-hydroxy-6-hydroxymethyldihydropteridine diphosphokinase [Spirabiliibacterium pneumoniae]
MIRAYIALGSNLANPVQQLNHALAALKQLPHSTLSAVSPFYQSTPLGPQDQPDYINAVAALDTALAPLDLLDHLQRIEHAQGRIRKRRWGERTLDLDILLYSDEIIHTERLTVPHYDMHQREFVLIPLLDIAPNLTLPDGTALKQLATPFAQHRMQKVR